MQPFPHHHVVVASGAATGHVELRAHALPVLQSAPPIEFERPGNLWSPETLLVGAIGDCFVLTFRAVARASRLDWTSIECEVRGELDRADQTVRFTRFEIRVRLTVPNERDRELAGRVLQRAERGCLITNSLNAETHLTTDVTTASNACLAGT